MREATRAGSRPRPRAGLSPSAKNRTDRCSARSSATLSQMFRRWGQNGGKRRQMVALRRADSSRPASNAAGSPRRYVSFSPLVAPFSAAMCRFEGIRRNEKKENQSILDNISESESRLLFVESCNPEGQISQSKEWKTTRKRPRI